MRAENGTQTRDPQLGRLVLYRLSYFRGAALKSALAAFFSRVSVTFIPNQQLRSTLLI